MLNLEVFVGPWSPFARKVVASAMRLGIAEHIRWSMVEMTTSEDCDLVIALNPLGKIPILRAPGQVLVGSTQICLFLQLVARGTLLVPSGDARWPLLQTVELADGLLEAGLLARNEVRRPGDRQWGVARDFQLRKVSRALNALDGAVSGFSESVPSLAEIATGCAVGWLDARLPDVSWRDKAPTLARWWVEASRQPCFARSMPPLSLSVLAFGE